MSEVIDAEAVEVGELVPVQRRELSVAPEVSAGDLVKRLEVIKGAMHDAMERDVDYGIIPGTNKPALLKPGAEKLSVLFQLDVELDNEKIWHPDGHLTVISKATAYHAPTGTRLGSGEGICSTRESRYAQRTANRKCVVCGAEAIIKGKEEYGGGWICFKRKGGCGEKYSDDDPQITSQAVGKVDNPDIADTYNTVTKMASKRARVDAILSVTGASALFTQDVEDSATEERTAASEPAPKPTTPSFTGSKSYAEWEARMVSIGITDAAEWARSALELSGVTDGKVARLDTALRFLFTAGAKAGTVREVTTEQIQAAFATAFDGILVPDPVPF